MKIYCTHTIPEKGINLLKEKGWDVEINTSGTSLSPEELIEKTQGVDALLCLLTDHIDRSFFEASTSQLKVVSNYAVGFDNIDIDAAKEKGVAVTNTPGVLTESVAEHTFALMLTVARKIVDADGFVRAGKYKGWEPDLFIGSEIHGKTLGVVGLGRIGESVVRRAHHGFNMTILYSDLKPNEAFEQEYNAEKCELHDLLKRSDFVSLHVPLLESTHHLIGAFELKMMKPTSFLVNTARGAVIDENALYEALKKNEIKGAGIDVYEYEPNIVEGLLTLDNIVLTPHIASATIEARESMSVTAAQNIVAILEGTEPVSRVA